jgi:hypothetical protein
MSRKPLLTSVAPVSEGDRLEALAKETAAEMEDDRRAASQVHEAMCLSAAESRNSTASWQFGTGSRHPSR